MATLTPDQFADKLDLFSKGLPKEMNKAAFKAAQQLNANITGRIFTTSGSKDTQGNTRRYRSAEWVAERRAAGKTQLTFVDHSFTGNLMRSIKLVQTKNEVEMKIIGALNVEKARDNEDLYPSGKVFFASKKEKEIAYKVFEDTIVDYIQSIF